MPLSDEFAILVAVMRFELGRLEEAARTSRAPGVLCVKVRARAQDAPADPDPAILEPFAATGSRVRPGSACTVQNWQVHEAGTGERAVLLDVGPVVRPPGKAEAGVSGAPYRAAASRGSSAATSDVSSRERRARRGGISPRGAANAEAVAPEDVAVVRRADDLDEEAT